jgi:hypothetical protein
VPSLLIPIVLLVDLVVVCRPCGVLQLFWPGFEFCSMGSAFSRGFRVVFVVFYGEFDPGSG